MALILTPAEAQRLQDEARAAGRWITWFVAVTDGHARAWAVMAGPPGGIRLPDELVANTLDELRARLPTGLMRWERTAMMSAEVVEVWD